MPGPQGASCDARPAADEPPGRSPARTYASDVDFFDRLEKDRREERKLAFDLQQESLKALTTLFVEQRQSEPSPQGRRGLRRPRLQV